MDVETARLIGAGLAAIGLIGAGLGVGMVWSGYYQALARNPASREHIGAMIWIGFAVTEALGLFAMMISLLILFS